MKRTLTHLSLTIFVLCALPASAWHTLAHRSIGEAAARALPADVPEFFRQGAEAVGHLAVDPDLMKDRATPQMRNRESPEHYLDWELLQGKGMAPLRYEFLEQLQNADLNPRYTGFLPFAIVENMQRLTLAFAEHRKWPENPHIRKKVLVYAGLMAHYSADLCQPLHTTIHHDGRAKADGSTPRSGIHQRVDALIERLQFGPLDIEPGLVIESLQGDEMEAVLREFAASHAEVDRVYELEPYLEPDGATGEWSGEVVDFTRDRFRESVRFTASLYLTAWERSATLALPGWLIREEPDDQEADSARTDSFLYW